MTMPNPLPLDIHEISLDAVRDELRTWQRKGLAGISRTEAEADRIAMLWARIDRASRVKQRKARANGATFTDNYETDKPVYYCEVCGGYASHGYGVNLRAGKTGRWYCNTHKPQVTP
jgi:hypothetical protein